MTAFIRKHFLRFVLTALAALLGSGVILGLVQANVQAWAQASGNDQYLIKYLGPAMDKLAQITSSLPFIFVTAMIVGGSIFLWADSFVRRWLEWRASQGNRFSWKAIDRRLASTQMKADAAREALEFMMKEPQANFTKAIQDYTQWRNTVRSQLLEIRRQISP